MNKAILIDELLKRDHPNLSPEDECLYLIEYIPQGGYLENSLISNIKKPMDRKGLPEWKYKDTGIRKAATMIREAILPIIKSPSETTAIPIPPCKRRDHPLYDDRMLQIANLAFKDTGVKVCDIFESISDREPSMGGTRLNVRELKQTINLNETLIYEIGSIIYLLDDVITEGVHFTACKEMLQSFLGAMPIKGIFIARRKREMPSLEDFYDLDLF